MKLLKSYFILCSLLLLFTNGYHGQFYYDSIANMVGDSMEIYCIRLIKTFEENIDLNYDAAEELIPVFIPNISKTVAQKNCLLEAKIRDKEKTEDEH